MKKLSIIVPVYNVRLYVEECIKSLISQNYENFEIIIVDDGSTDGSSSVCDSLQSLSPRIIVIHQDNGGLPAARNRGLEAATGDYICFIDSDDIVAPEMFKTLIEKLEEHDASVAICNFEVFNKIQTFASNRYHNEVINYSDDNPISFYRAALDSSCNRVFKAEAIKNIRFEPKSKVAQEDYWFQIRLFTHIDRIVTIEDGFYKYRQRGSSITKSHSDGDISERCLNFIKYTKDYICSSSSRSVTSFINYLFVDMFQSSIFNASNYQYETLNQIVSNYLKESQFKEAIQPDALKHAIESRGVRRFVDRITFFLVRMNWIRLYAMIMSQRFKRIRQRASNEMYYE